MMLTNREIALRFNDLISLRRIDEAFALTSDDVVFRGPDGTKLDRDGLKALLQYVWTLMAGPFKTEIVGTTCEGERVAVEMTASVELVNGGKYDNIYHFIVIVRDGKIMYQAEYCNTKAADVFGDLTIHSVAS
jgi:ketosteroid isomerase-like protein